MKTKIKNAIALILVSILIGLAYGLVIILGWQLVWGDEGATAPAEGAGRIAPAPIETTEETTLIEDTSEEAAEPEPKSLGTFKLTAYCACPQCCGEWSDGVTYTGTTATAGRTIAVDPDVIPLGSTVYINGTPYIAEDIGGAIEGNRIDVYFPSHQDAIEFGVQYAEISIF